MKSYDKENKKEKKIKPDDKYKRALDFFAEAGLLKRVKRSGWWVLGISNPESVAEHSFRCAVIGFYMARLEKVNPCKVIMMTLFNDIHEARINDLHKMGHYYIDFKEAEKKVFKEQIQFLEMNAKAELALLRNEYDRQASRESIVARDADILECLLQAKEYYDSGCATAKKFFVKAPDFLKTKSAKQLWRAMRTWDSSAWWQSITRFER